MKNKPKIYTLLVLTVFCTFTFSVFGALILGVQFYEKTREITLEYDDDRTCLSYIWAKIKNGDEAGRMYITDFHGISALCMEEERNSTLYLTFIYHHDGWVRELFTEAGYELSLKPKDGSSIVKADWLMFEYTEGGLIRAETNFGSVAVLPRSGGNRYE